MLLTAPDALAQVCYLSLYWCLLVAWPCLVLG
jgi:hypothetical protein